MDFNDFVHCTDIKPWCYTTDPGKRWEYCDIPMCDELQTTTAPEATTASQTITTFERNVGMLLILSSKSLPTQHINFFKTHPT